MLKRLQQRPRRVHVGNTNAPCLSAKYHSIFWYVGSTNAPCLSAKYHSILWYADSTNPPCLSAKYHSILWFVGSTSPPCLSAKYHSILWHVFTCPGWSIADADVKVSFAEYPKPSTVPFFVAWSRSEYSDIRLAYCRNVPVYCLPSQSRVHSNSFSSKFSSSIKTRAE